LLEEKEKESLSPELLNRIVTCLYDEKFSSGENERMNEKLLQILCLLLQHIERGMLVNHRPLIIKFIWKRLKCRNSTTKTWAFLSSSIFFCKYNMPDGHVLEVN
jgi:hypothetical protein